MGASPSFADEVDDMILNEWYDRMDMPPRGFSQWPDPNPLISTLSLPYHRQERVTYSGGGIYTALFG